MSVPDEQGDDFDGEAVCDDCDYWCVGPLRYGGFCCTCGVDVCHECRAAHHEGHRFE